MDVQGGGVVVGDGSSGQGCWRGEANHVAAVGETCITNTADANIHNNNGNNARSCGRPPSPSLPDDTLIYCLHKLNFVNSRAANRALQV